MDYVYLSIAIPSRFWDSISSAVESGDDEVIINRLTSNDYICLRCSKQPQGYNLAVELPISKFTPQLPIPRLNESIQPLLSSSCLPVSSSPSPSKPSTLSIVKEWIYNPNRNENTPVTIAELASILNLTKQKVSRSLNSLYKDKLIDFDVLENDQRLIKVLDPF